MNLDPSLGESLENQYTAAYASLVEAIEQAQQRHSLCQDKCWNGHYNPSVAVFAASFRPFLALHSQMPSDVALDAFPLMLTALLILYRPFGPSHHSACPVERDTLSQASTSLHERLASLSVLALDLETVPSVDQLGTYRAQYDAFANLLVLEDEVAHISLRLMREMNRLYPRAPVLLGAVFDLKRVLKGGVVPFWLVFYCALPDRLVRLSHLCRRFAYSLEDGELWRHMRLAAIECLEQTYVASDAGYEHSLLVACLRGRTFHELKISLPSFDRDSAFSRAPDSAFSRAPLTEADFERGSPPIALSLWELYDSDLTEDGRRETTTRVLCEFAAMSSYLAGHHKKVYEEYRRHIVEARDKDEYPFLPVNVHGPDSEAYDWSFDPYHRPDNPLHIPDAADWKDRMFVYDELDAVDCACAGDDLEAADGVYAEQRIVDRVYDRPAPDHEESPAADPP